MKSLIFTGLATCISATALAAPNDAYCLKLGKMAQSAAQVMEAGGTEEMLKKLRAASVAKDKQVKSEDQQKIDQQNEAMMDTVSSYVFTTKQESKTARLVVYKKCLSGDFN